MNRPLQKNKRAEQQVTFPASGTVTATVIVPLGPAWEIKQISIKVTGATNQTQCDTYIGIGATGVFISHSYTGNADTDSEPNVTLRSGDALSAVWSGGLSGAIARLTLVYDEVAY